MRLDCFLSRNTDCSRKSVKKYILQSKVKINGTVCLDVSYKIKEDDVISLNGKVIDNIKNHVIALNKPENYISSMVDERYPSLMRLIDSKYHKTYRLVGRLDYDTTGLIILTNDGELTNLLIHPKNCVDKVYVAKVKGLVGKKEISALTNGVYIDGVKTSKAKARIKKYDKKTDTSIVELTIHEGKNHQVKKMFEAIGYNVLKLKRERIAFLDLTGLKSGEYRILNPKEVKKLYSLVVNR